MARIKLNEKYRRFKTLPNGRDLIIVVPKTVILKNGETGISNETGAHIQVVSGMSADILATIKVTNREQPVTIFLDRAEIKKNKDGRFVVRIPEGTKMYNGAKYDVVLPEEAIMRRPTLGDLIKKI